MGRPGCTPILQLGGVHDAKSVAPPRLLREVALLLSELLVVVLKAATSGLVVLQVNGGLRRTNPGVSTTVAVTFTEPPLVTVMEFPACPCPPIWSRMY